MKLQRKKINSNHYLAIFIVICAILIGVSVFAGSVLTPVKSAFTFVLSPMQKGINTVGNAAFSWNEETKTKKELRTENKLLNEKLNAMRMQNRLLKQDQVELDRLQGLLKLKKKYEKYHTVGARVISKGSSNWFEIFSIDKGSKDGIKKDMNVIADDGLVGIVYDVTANSAKVRTIINDTSMVSAMFLKTSDSYCIVKGSLDTIEDGYLDVVYIDKDAKVKNGDEIVTSNVSSKFNEGITIGKVSNIKMDSTKLTKTARVTPVVDFKHLKEVLVITDIKKTENLDTNTKE
ncbi:rod shape-determining protein MreC [Anaerostipes sp. MSJ-23]|uniref:rod shape-determining protein MreC n=1 Tax=Anaerostipes sp. MSJ-23 TaxID=2841520 RepID=UPI001C124912|nr:rod shape-determining protein MreC [Anaerostipes sp. MSJ-23]MBU5458979.1 rod shape-determining protein MreC [Anaerostipes sp. MSJ-23]